MVFFFIRRLLSNISNSYVPIDNLMMTTEKEKILAIGNHHKFDKFLFIKISQNMQIASTFYKYASVKHFFISAIYILYTDQSFYLCLFVPVLTVNFYFSTHISLFVQNSPVLPKLLGRRNRQKSINESQTAIAHTHHLSNTTHQLSLRWRWTPECWFKIMVEKIRIPEEGIFDLL